MEVVSVIFLTIFEKMGEVAFLQGLFCGFVLSIIAAFFLKRDTIKDLRDTNNLLKDENKTLREELEKQKQEYEREITKLTINNSARFYQA